jgi:isochorismate synthase EntC
LQRRPKDLHEHALVVEEIRRRLAPRCQSLAVGARPSVRRWKDLAHLRTPVRGRLKTNDHLLALALRLHPTPAVGGLPTGEAVDWIHRHEPTARGWYAGFFGWFDAAGDGELAVSIRSGLVHDRWAWIFAGAGIVPESNAADEYRETALKQRPFLRGLGAIA